MTSIKEMVPRLRFSGFQGNWEKKLLPETTDIYNKLRKPIEKSERAKRNGPYPYYGASGVIDNLDDFLFDGEFVLIAEDGANILTRSSRLAFIAKGKFWVNNHAHVLKSLQNNYFLCELLEKLDYKKYNTSSTQPKLNLESLKSISFYMPKVEEQQKIASFLSSVDDKISQLEKKKTLLETYKRGIMQKIFSQELRFKDGNGQEFPDWDEKKLGEIANFFSGGTPNSSNQSFYKGDIPFIGSGDIKKKTVNKFITSEALDSSSAKIIEKGDLLYALYGATSGQVSLSKLRGAINQAVLCIRTDQSKMFLLSVLEYNKERILDKYLQGGQGNLSAKIVKSFIYSFPCLEEQKKIASFLSSIDNKIQITSSQLEKTREFKKGLLQQMFV